MRPRRASSSRTRRLRRTRCDGSVSLVPHLVNGVALGLLFALIALGFMLIVSVMETINLAHGSFFALGMYIALVRDVARRWHVGAVVRLSRAPGRLALCDRAGRSRRRSWAAFGMLLELALRRTYGRDRAVRAAADVRRGARDRGGHPRRCSARPRSSCRCPTPSPVRSCWASSSTRSTAVFACALRRRRDRAALWLFLQKTPYGSIIKAGAHDSEMVRALGINLTRLRLFVFALGVALAAIAGIVMSPIWGIRPHVGRRRRRAGLPHHRAGRRRQLLGRGAGGAAGRAGRRD